MSGKTEIAWTDRVWNPSVGCTRVSAGCDHCYAFALHDRRHVAWKRGRWPAAPAQYHEPFSRVQLLPDRLMEPLRWKKPCRIFVNSMSDLFHKDVPDEWLDRIFAVMALTPHLTFQVLTKRPERMREYLSNQGRASAVEFYRNRTDNRAERLNTVLNCWPLRNVWLGVSAEDQERADERIPDLLATPAAVRWVSYEPALGPLDLRLSSTHVLLPSRMTDHAAAALREKLRDLYTGPAKAHAILEAGANVVGLDWVICGGESGPGARAFDLAWARSLRDQCAAAGVAFFMKQLGENAFDSTPGTTFSLSAYRKRKSRHGEDPEEWPADLRIREWPEGCS